MHFCFVHCCCRWRQLSEPADQVVWVDLLTKREFEQGFGSHTPMYSGQTKCVRYYMNFNRAMELAKECLLEVSLGPLLSPSTLHACRRMGVCKLGHCDTFDPCAQLLQQPD